MMQLSIEFKQAVLKALFVDRQNYGGSDKAFAEKWQMNNSVYSQLKNGKLDGLLKDSQFLTIGRELNVMLNERKWNVASTYIYNEMKDNLMFCQQHSQSMLLVDDTSIGKSFCSKHICRGLKNAFYLDCSQSKTKQLFIRTLAQTIGVDNTGKYNTVKANLKYYLKQLHKPLIVLDEAGDLEYTAFLELKELWNATEDMCGFYMMGADGLEAKINRGVDGKKVGFRELLSRFNNHYLHLVPVGNAERLAFYRQLITDVATVNCTNTALIPKLVKQCLGNDETGKIGGLRRLKSLIQLN